MKKIILIFSVLALTVPLLGQNTKKMNSIKRNPFYLYAEATMETAEEAFEVANDLLLIQIKEYASTSAFLKDKDVLIKNIRSQQDSLQIRRGDMVKVFLYVKKTDLQAVDNVTLLENASAPQKETAPGEVSVESNVATPPTPEQASPQTGVADASLKLEAAWQQAVIDNLLSAGSYSEARAMLSRLKAEFKIKKTGPVESARDISEVYLLIGKNGNVETVLGPGRDSRTDFKALQKTSSSFEGYDKVWFTFAK